MPHIVKGLEFFSQLIKLSVARDLHSKKLLPLIERNSPLLITCYDSL